MFLGSTTPRLTHSQITFRVIDLMARAFSLTLGKEGGASFYFLIEGMAWLIIVSCLLPLSHKGPLEPR
jgi:hypothetical protein